MNAPKLRFKEFRNDWDSKLFGELYSIKNGLNKEKEAFGSGTPIVNYMDVNKNTFIDIHEINGKVNLTDSEIERFLVRNNDLFFTRTSESSKEIGLTCSYIGENTNLVFSGFVLKASPKSKAMDSTFYAYYLRTDNKRKEIIKHSSITTRALTSGTLLSSMPVNYTSIEEQQKIANFLKKIDHKIQLQQEKIELLKEQKKGYIQKIFNQELRFKDSNGNFYREWEEQQLRSLFEIRDERQIPTDEAPLMAFTSTGGVEEKGDRYNREFLVKDKNKKYKRTELNDLIYSSNNLDVGAIGRNKYGTAVISDVYEIFKTKEITTPEFSEMIIQQKSFLNKVLKYRQGALYGQYRIHADDFLSVRVRVPNLEEQIKIGEFFSFINRRIVKEMEKLDVVIEQKKGFLQQMFI